MFSQYLQLGFSHITDLEGYDHMLFLLALAASFRYSDWRKVLVLVTAFTIGHSVTLALSVLDVVRISKAWVEFLIPVTILITAVLNLYRAKNYLAIRRIAIEYTLASLFGLIHGLGFSNYLRALLADEIAMPLFSFNIGLELGQILVLSIIFGVQFVLSRLTGRWSKHWSVVVSVLAGGISLLLAAQRIPVIQ